MRILVTGLGGFIGSSLGPLLESRGHEVRGAGREVRELAQAFRGCGAVVHLANIAHADADPALLWRVNVEGTGRAGLDAAALPRHRRCARPAGAPFSFSGAPAGIDSRVAEADAFAGGGRFRDPA